MYYQSISAQIQCLERFSKVLNSSQMQTRIPSATCSIQIGSYCSSQHSYSVTMYVIHCCWFPVRFQIL